ncbi:MAG: 50S ribosomal protein L11 methyltransferase [Deltaproteobacteria bacterium]|nr:50S ribosomal protein L11 methyltransferase [Deltaproteobacteria bacterium]
MLYIKIAMVEEFIINNTEIVSFPLLREIKLRVLTEKSRFFYAKESEFLRFGIVDPFFLFCWPGGQALSRFILDNSELIKGKGVLIFGSGCGVEAIASVLCGAKYVLASDIDPNALVMSSINMRLNEVDFELTDSDFFLSDCSEFDVILAGDMYYDKDMTEKIFGWFARLKDRVLVLGADPLRGYVDHQRIKILKIYDTLKDGEVYTNRLIKTPVFTII